MSQERREEIVESVIDKRPEPDENERKSSFDLNEWKTVSATPVNEERDETTPADSTMIELTSKERRDDGSEKIT